LPNDIGGAINGEGSLTIEVKGSGNDSFVSQVIDLVKQAQESKSKPASSRGDTSRDQGPGITGGRHARRWRKITTNEYAILF